MTNTFLQRPRRLAIPLLCMVAASSTALANHADNGCDALPDHATVQAALKAAVTAETTGLNLNMWATIVDRQGVVCVVAYSGDTAGAQWLGSRVISAQKANTANLFSLDSSSVANSSGAGGGLALSTANLYSAVQPGGSLFGLSDSNPVDPSVAYGGDDNDYGAVDDPMVGYKVGGVNVFGGGFGLYAEGSVLVGGLGVSGDTSCADHRIGWRVRNNLGLDHLSGVGGVSGDPLRPDNIVFDIQGNSGMSAGGFGHPHCTQFNDGAPHTLPPVQ